MLPPVVGIHTAETTVEYNEQINGVQITPTTISIEVIGTAGGDANSVEFTMNVNGQPQGTDSKMTLNTDSRLTTEFTFPATTLSLSFTSRQTAFRFEGGASTEITLPSGHVHVTVNGIETAVDLPGLVTTVEVTDSTVVLIELPETATTLEFTAETYTFTMEAYTISAGDTNSGQNAGSSYCGTQTTDGDSGSTCIMSILTVVTPPNAAEVSNLYLRAVGPTNALTLPGITTTFKSVGRKKITTPSTEPSCTVLILFFLECPLSSEKSF